MERVWRSDDGEIHLSPYDALRADIIHYLKELPVRESLRFVSIQHGTQGACAGMIEAMCGVQSEVISAFTRFKDELVKIEED